MKYCIYFAGLFLMSATFAQSAGTKDSNTVFSEKFYNNNNQWPVKTNGPATYMLSDHSYIMENTDNQSRLVTIMVTNPLKAYIIFSNTKHLGGVQNEEYGLFFGGSNNSSGYAFVITANGYYKVYRYNNNVYEKLIPWTFNENIFKGEVAFNVLKVKVRGSDIDFYSNDHYLNTVSGYTLYGNRVGFTKSGNQRVQFQNLMVQKKEDEWDFDFSSLFSDSSFWKTFNYPRSGKIITEKKDSLKEISHYNFEGEMQGWTYDVSHSNLRNGNLALTGETGKLCSASHYMPAKQTKEYAVAVDAKHTNGVDAFAYGLLIGEGTGDNDIKFYISGTGYFKILQGKSNLTEWTKNVAIKTGDNATNHLEIYRSDSVFKFYVNGEMLYTLPKVFKYNKLLVSLIVTEKQTVEFDNLQMRGTYDRPLYVE